VNLGPLLDRRDAFLAFLATRVESRAVAEDLLQEAFAKAVTAEVRGEDALVAWFYQVLRNAVTDHHRRRGAAGRALDRFAGEAPAEELPPEPPKRVCPCVARLAGELKPEYAEALRRVEVDGVAVKDLAGELGITSGNAAVRVFRARESLRGKVKKTCGACAAAGCTDCSCVS
jgi:RNA polymerase sigma-70 factor (ECF subfamily)